MNDNDELTFIRLAVAVANVIYFLENERKNYEGTQNRAPEDARGSDASRINERLFPDRALGK